MMKEDEREGLGQPMYGMLAPPLLLTSFSQIIKTLEI
jgi:hypothetical protein